MFYNTNIATYIWVLDNTKRPNRVGKVQLIDATDKYVKMRKNLGAKSRELSEQNRADILRLHDAMVDGEHSKVFTPDEFGYWTITVERPLRLNFACTPDRIEKALDARPLKNVDHRLLRQALESFGAAVYTNRETFLTALNPVLGGQGIRLGTPQRKALWTALGEHDDTADICYDKHGTPEPDPDLRDTENVPFTHGGNTDGAAGRQTTIQAYFDTEVRPHVPDAWIDTTKTKIGYEIPFTRHFYKYVPPRPLEEIDADLEAQVAKILSLLREVER